MDVIKAIISCALIFNLLSVQDFGKVGEPETEMILRKEENGMQIIAHKKQGYGVFSTEGFAAEKRIEKPECDWVNEGCIAVGKRLIKNDGYGSTRNVKIVGEEFWGGLSIAIEVRIYNRNDDDYNKADGILFFEDLMRICKVLDYEGIPLEAMLAQAYTEGGAGKRGVYTMSNNLFGIRAGANWKGYVYARNLKKTFVNYETARAFGGEDLFRAYPNIAESIKDYINLIRTSELYKGALHKSAKKYLKYITKRGYGDESMVSVWLNVIKIYKLKGE